VDVELLAERLGDVDGVAPHQRVADQQCVCGRGLLADLSKLFHQRIVDRESPRGVVDDRVVAFRTRAFAGGRADRGRRFALGACVDRDVELFAELLQLQNRGRPVDVCRDQQRPALLALEVARELGRDGGLADALEADEHQRHHTTLALCELRVDRPHQRRELFFADLHEVLPGGDLDAASARIAHACVDLFAERPLLDGREEVLHHREVDIGFEQRHAHVAQRLIDVLLGQLSHAGELLAGAGESLGQCFEHGFSEARRIADVRLPPCGLLDCNSGCTMTSVKHRRGLGERMTTEVAAQIAGNLWKLEKAVGDTVEEEDVIMIIESMKMEIPVEAPRAGTIARIAVAEGDSIEEGMILAVIE